MRAGDPDAGNASETMYWWKANEDASVIIDRVKVMAKEHRVSFKIERKMTRAYNAGLPKDVKVFMLHTVHVTTPTPDPYLRIWADVLKAATHSDIGQWH
jgi:hypothetical protein